MRHSFGRHPTAPSRKWPVASVTAWGRTYPPPGQLRRAAAPDTGCPATSSTRPSNRKMGSQPMVTSNPSTNSPRQSDLFDMDSMKARDREYDNPEMHLRANLRRMRDNVNTVSTSHRQRMQLDTFVCPYGYGPPPRRADPPMLSPVRSPPLICAHGASSSTRTERRHVPFRTLVPSSSNGAGAR